MRPFNSVKIHSLSKSISFLIILVSIFVPGLSSAETPTGIIDIHYHFSRNNPYNNGEVLPFLNSFNNLQEYLEQTSVEAVFVTSDSYRYKQEYTQLFEKYRQQGNLEFFDPKWKLALNKEVSELTKKFPQRVLGICGVNLDWEDMVEQAEKCLSLPGMYGVKVHFQTSSFPTIKAAEERLGLLYSVLAKYNSFLLLHGPYFQTEDNCSEPLEDTEVLLKLQRKYANVKLVLAHSGVGQTIGCAGQRLIKLALLGNGLNKSKNDLRIFADTALALEHYPSNPSVKLLNVLKEFYAALGETHILFGSDSTAQEMAYSEYTKQVGFVKSNFNNEEQNKIFNQNALELIGK